MNPRGASRPSPESEASEEEPTRRWWEWQRPAAKSDLDELQLESISDFECIDEPTLDHPAEIDVAALDACGAGARAT